MKTRILVLTSSTGSGHDMRAKAFSEWIESAYGPKFEVRIEQIIENGSLLGKFGVWVYNTIHRHAPFLHNIYFFIVELFIFSHSRFVTFGGKYYRRLLEHYRPHIVFSVHDSTNRGYFEDARRVLGPGVRCGTYCGEFSGGYGFSRNWVNPSADFFIARTQSTRDFAIRLGMPPGKAHVFHKLLPPNAFAPLVSESEKRAFQEEAGFSKERFTLFLATGGFGANHHVKFLKACLPFSDQLQVIIVCGRNQQVLKDVQTWSHSHPQLKTLIEGFSQRMALFLQISDAVLTRGGANTTMEALHFDCPLLYDAIGGLMPQEQCTVRYFTTHGAARLLKGKRDLQAVLSDWSCFGEDYQSIKRQLAKLHFEEDVRDLLKIILGPFVPSSNSH